MNIDELRKKPSKSKAELTVDQVEEVAADLNISMDSDYEEIADELKKLKKLVKRISVVEALLKAKMIQYQLSSEASPIIDMPVAGALPSPPPAQGAPKVEGISTSKPWKLRILDEDALCQFFLECRPGQGYAKIDTKKAEKLLKTLNGAIEWDGAEAYRDRTISVRSEG